MEDLRTLLVFLGLLCAFVLITVMLGLRERRRSRSKLIRSLREGFGRPSCKKMSSLRYEQIPQYYRHHTEDFSIDDITWNDLEMDQLFHAMDTTCSAAGEEYLYYLLRTPVMSPDSLPFSREQYAYFSAGAHEEERLRLQEILHALGHAGRYSLYDYMDFTDSLGERGNLPHYLAAAAPFAAFALMFLHTGIGILALLIVFSLNLLSYFREKAKIAPHFHVFQYILRLLDAAGDLAKVNCPAFAEETAAVPGLLDSFSSFRRGSSLLLGSTGGGSDPLGFIMEYVRILFHLDLIKFNSMLHQMRGRQKQISELLAIAGRIDSCLSIVSFKETLPFSAEPQLRGAAGPQGGFAGFPFEVADLYHPLLPDPVSNSLSTDRPVLLTGSNASGKSTFLKAAALCALLSQTVGIAPAREYRGSCYRIYTSMALRDSLQDGDSYFIVEIKSLRRILAASRETDRSPVLCCIDEVLRGTNTVERIAASTEILQAFAGAGAVCFSATHDLELTGLLSDTYKNCHFSEEIADGDVRFSYRLLDGPSNSCNAIALLSSLGYDSALVERASTRADRFLRDGTWQ